MSEEEILLEDPDEEEEEITVLSSRKYNPKYYEKDFLDKLGDYYNETQNYSETARRLNSQFNTSITSEHVKRIYIKNVALHMTHSKKAGEFFEQSFEKIKERWNDAWEMVGDLVKQYKRLKQEMEEKEGVEQALLFMKLSPTIIGISQQIQKQLEFIQNQQEQIKVQQNTLIYSPLQINQYLGPIIKELVDEGKIKIMKDMGEFGFGIDESKDGKKEVKKK